jgi:hypothetical protein
MSWVGIGPSDESVSASTGWLLEKTNMRSNLAT